DGAMLGPPAIDAEDLDLLDAVGAQDRDRLAFQQVRVRRRIEQEMVELAVELAVGGGEGDGGQQRYRRRAFILGGAARAGIRGRGCRGRSPRYGCGSLRARAGYRLQPDRAPRYWRGTCRKCSRNSDARRDGGARMPAPGC